ncbi:MAG: NADH-quinone oxidoreductase subunit M [Desulfuromonadales bacterium]|nr:MAG: NADH-quinone oxidoreductase subunit M [Desulfuromonadales bacterium]
MPESLTILLLLTLPLAGALLVGVLPARNSILPRIVAMASMLVVLVLAAGLFYNFDGTIAGEPLGLNVPWIASLGVNLHLAVDGLNAYFLLLTALLFPVVLGSAWRTREAQFTLYLALLLVLEASLFGTFLAQNLMIFFVFWEAVLIPMCLLILAFGGEQRRQAAMTFFLYTLVGSVLLLAAVLLLGVEGLHQTGRWSFEFGHLEQLHLGWETELFVFCSIVLACAIKCPLFPFHSWLPLSYCEAPFSGTALMAGVLSKMGAFGILKLALPLCPEVSAVMAPYLEMLAVASIVHGAVIALRQEDFRRLVAYASLSHMGYIVLGIFSLQNTAMHGALFQVLSHGVTVVGLLLVLSVLEQRLGTSWRQVNALATSAPHLAIVLMLFILASVALPLTSGFTSEFMILFGAFQHAMAAWTSGALPIQLGAVVVAATVMVLSAGYMLRFGRTILFGESSCGTPLWDLNLREAMVFFPLLLVIVWIGIWPNPIMTRVGPAVSRLTQQVAGKSGLPLALSSLTSPDGGANGR